MVNSLSQKDHSTISKKISIFFACRTLDKDKLAALQQKINMYWTGNFENNAVRAVGGNPCDVCPDYI